MRKKWNYENAYNIISAQSRFTTETYHEPNKDPKLLCYWCCHGFQNTPRGLPVKCDEQRNKFILRGVFCSWACALTYSKEIVGGYKSTDREYWIRQLSRKMDPSNIEYTKPAPSREFLEAFGGPMDIETFRKASIHKKNENTKYLIERPPVIIMVAEEQRLLSQIERVSHIPALPNRKPQHLMNKKAYQEREKKDVKRRYVIKKKIQGKRNDRLRSLGIKVS